LAIIANGWPMGHTSRMPTRNVNLTKELDQFVADRVSSGRYENASEVVRAALRCLEHDEKTRALDEALAEGEASGVDADFPTTLKGALKRLKLK